MEKQALVQENKWAPYKGAGKAMVWGGQESELQMLRIAGKAGGARLLQTKEPPRHKLYHQHHWKALWTKNFQKAPSELKGYSLIFRTWRFCTIYFISDLLLPFPTEQPSHTIFHPESPAANSVMVALQCFSAFGFSTAQLASTKVTPPSLWPKRRDRWFYHHHPVWTNGAKLGCKWSLSSLPLPSLPSTTPSQ